MNNLCIIYNDYNRYKCLEGYVEVNPSKVLTGPRTGREKPHPSSARWGSKPCVTKRRRLGGLTIYVEVEVSG